jgi:hypothetical protein
MIIKYLPLAIIASALVFVSCTKEAQEPGAGTSAVARHSGPIASIAGAWQETKVVTYLLDPLGNKLEDTTYLQPFTVADYAVFNNDGTCAISIDHYYFQNGPGTSIAQAIPQLVNNYAYSAAGSNYLLTPQNNVQGPGGGYRTDTVSLQDSHTLLIHTVAHGIGPNALVSDSYYTNK